MKNHIRRRLETELEAARRQKETLSAELERIEAKSGDCLTDELRRACEKYGEACRRVIEAAEALEEFEAHNENETESKPVFFVNVVETMRKFVGIARYMLGKEKKPTATPSK